MRDKKVPFIGRLDFPGEEIFALIPPRSSSCAKASEDTMPASSS